MRRSNCHACARVSDNCLAQSRSFVRPESRICLARNFHTELGRQKKARRKESNRLKTNGLYPPGLRAADWV